STRDAGPRDVLRPGRRHRREAGRDRETRWPDRAVADERAGWSDHRTVRGSGGQCRRPLDPARTLGSARMATPVEEATELLQTMIRNQCVNDGRLESGGEVKKAKTLGAYLARPGMDITQYESRPGRGSMALRIEGSDKQAPSLLMMGHIDVVPADPNGWTRDPFCGDLIDGEIWGRGAIDMLSITVTMAVAVKNLLREGWKPKGTLIFSGMADEEALGTWGAEWLV